MFGGGGGGGNGPADRFVLYTLLASHVKKIEPFVALIFICVLERQKLITRNLTGESFFHRNFPIYVIQHKLLDIVNCDTEFGY